MERIVLSSFWTLWVDLVIPVVTSDKASLSIKRSLGQIGFVEHWRIDDHVSATITSVDGTVLEEQVRARWAGYEQQIDQVISILRELPDTTDMLRSLAGMEREHGEHGTQETAPT